MNQKEPDERQDERRRIADPEEVAQANRIRALLERRERCINALEETTVAKAHSEADESEAKLIFIAHLRSLIVDLYPLILSNTEQSDDSDEPDFYTKALEEETFGSFEVRPPESIPQSAVDDEIVRGEQPATTKEYEVTGLEWFLENECPVTVTWEIEIRGRAEKKVAERNVIPSLPVCLNAAKTAMECMEKLGLEADTQDEDSDFGFDYDTIDVHDELEENE